MKIKLFFVACFMALAGLATTAPAEPSYTPKQEEVRQNLKKVDHRIRELNAERIKRLNNDPEMTGKRLKYVVHELHRAYVVADTIRHYFGVDKYYRKHRSPYERVTFEVKRIMEIQKRIDLYKTVGSKNGKTEVSNKMKAAQRDALERKQKVFDRLEAHRAKIIKHYAKQLGIESTMK